MSTKSIILIFFTIISYYSYGQSGKAKEELKIENKEKLEALTGTYQIQMINTRSLPAIPANIHTTIKDLRHDTDTIYKFISPKTRLMILPNGAINKNNFTPIEHIKYVNY